MRSDEAPAVLIQTSMRMIGSENADALRAEIVRHIEEGWLTWKDLWTEETMSYVILIWAPATASP